MLCSLIDLWWGEVCDVEVGVGWRQGFVIGASHDDRNGQSLVENAPELLRHVIPTQRVLKGQGEFVRGQTLTLFSCDNIEKDIGTSIFVSLYEISGD